jgi:hypothetical protein
MPEEFSCPHCEKKLKVPDHLLGKRVKCPGCGNGFLAGSEDTLSEPNEDEEDRPRRRRPVDQNDEPEEQADEGAAKDDEEDQEEEEERPRRKRRRRRSNAKSRAKSAVMAPGIAMMVLGVLGFFVAVWYVVQAIYDVRLFGDPPANAGTPGYKAAHYGIIVTGFLWSFIVTFGGYCLMSLRNHGMAKFAAVFAMLPCNSCCFLGIPVGIWALIQLNNADVYNQFD